MIHDTEAELGENVTIQLNGSCNEVKSNIVVYVNQKFTVAIFMVGIEEGRYELHGNELTIYNVTDDYTEILEFCHYTDIMTLLRHIVIEVNNVATTSMSTTSTPSICTTRKSSSEETRIVHLVFCCIYITYLLNS